MNPTCSRATVGGSPRRLTRPMSSPGAKKPVQETVIRCVIASGADRGQFQRPRGGRLGQRQRLFRIALHPQGGCRAAIGRSRGRRIERLSRSAAVAGFQEHAAATADLGTLEQGGQQPGLAPVGQECSRNPGRIRLLDRIAPVPRWPAPRSSCSSGAPLPDIRTRCIEGSHQRRSQARKPAEQGNDQESPNRSCGASRSPPDNTAAAAERTARTEVASARHVEALAQESLPWRSARGARPAAWPRRFLRP